MRIAVRSNNPQGSRSSAKPGMRSIDTICRLPVFPGPPPPLQTLLDACRHLLAESSIQVEVRMWRFSNAVRIRISTHSSSRCNLDSSSLSEVLRVVQSSVSLTTWSYSMGSLLNLPSALPSRCITRPSASTSQRRCSTSERTGSGSAPTSQAHSRSGKTSGRAAKTTKR